MTNQKETYNNIDHYHCWTSNTPPCGIKGTHRCCLCQASAPNQKEDFPTVDRPDLYEHARSLVERTWQDRFDKEMPKIIGGHGFGEDCFLYDSCNKLQELKSFIQSEIQLALSKQREEIREKIDEESKKYNETAISVQGNTTRMELIPLAKVQALLDIKNII